MKTSELTGALLDYWIAKAEGKNHLCFAYEIHGHMGSYSPSSNWEDGGPILQHESISVEVICYDNETDKNAINWEAKFEPPIRENDEVAPHWVVAEGRTALVAAMRAYVASKFGDEVEDLPIKGQS